MGNTLQRNLSQRKQVRSALERIDSLESDIQRIVMGVNEATSVQGQRLQELATIIGAVVELFGSEVVDAKIKEINERQAMERLEAAKAALEAGLAKGEVVKAEAVTEKSLVVGREISAAGEVIFPGRVQLQFSAIKPEFKEKLLGQGAGFQLETAAGGKFEVLEVYDVLDKPAEEPAAPEGADKPISPEELEKLEKALTPSEG